MTTTYGEKTTCAVCGNSAMYTYLSSTNSMGAPDLDGRPAEMERSTMAFWIHVCNSCEYVAPKISDAVEGARGVVASVDYKEQFNRAECAKLANLFLCWAMVLRRAGRLADSGRACLHAAWVCDDYGDKHEMNDIAIECRKTASCDLQQALSLSRQKEPEFEKEGYAEALLVDILRRSEQFDSAGVLCIEAITSEGRDEKALKLLAFQQELVEKKDTGCYTMDDIEQ